MNFFEFLKNEVIYDDGDVRVEIAGWFNYWLNYIRIEQIPLSKVFLERMIPLIYAQLSASGVDIKKPEKSYCSKATIFCFGAPLAFLPPFDKLNCVAELMENIYDLYKQKNEIEQAIQEFNQSDLIDGEIHYNIFEKPYKEICGWLAFVNEKEIDILFFGHKAPPKELFI